MNQPPENPYAAPNSNLQLDTMVFSLTSAGRRIYLWIAFAIAISLIVLQILRMSTSNELDQLFQASPFGRWYVFIWQATICLPFFIGSAKVGGYLGKLFKYSKLLYFAHFLKLTFIVSLCFSIWTIALEFLRFKFLSSGSISDDHLGEMAIAMPIVLFIAFFLLNGVVCIILKLYSRKVA